MAIKEITRIQIARPLCAIMFVAPDLSKGLEVAVALAGQTDRFIWCFRCHADRWQTRPARLAECD